MKKRRRKATSSALTETQHTYSQINKRNIGNRFKCKKFHKHIYGHKVIVEPQHTALHSIFKKGIPKMPASLL